MSGGYLSRLFTAAAFKRLNVGDMTVYARSGHILRDAQPLIALFGSYPRAAMSVDTYWFNREGDAIASQATLRWSKQHRSDQCPSRLALRDGELTDSMHPGNGIVIAARRNGPAILAVVRPDSTIENQLCWLFGMTDALRDNSYVVRRFPADHDAMLRFPENHILQELFINPDPPSPSRIATDVRVIPPSPPPA